MISIFCFEDVRADGNGGVRAVQLYTTPNWISRAAKNISSFLGLINEQSLFMCLFFLLLLFLFFCQINLQMPAGTS